MDSLLNVGPLGLLSQVEVSLWEVWPGKESGVQNPACIPSLLSCVSLSHQGSADAVPTEDRSCEGGTGALTP